MAADPVLIGIPGHIRGIDVAAVKPGIDQGSLPDIGPFHGVRKGEAEVRGVPGGGDAVIHHIFAEGFVPDDIRRPDMIAPVIGGNDAGSAAGVIEDMGVCGKDIAPDAVGGDIAVGLHDPGAQVIRRGAGHVGAEDIVFAVRGQHGGIMNRHPGGVDAGGNILPVRGIVLREGSGAEGQEKKKAQQERKRFHGDSTFLLQ